MKFVLELADFFLIHQHCLRKLEANLKHSILSLQNGDLELTKMTSIICTLCIIVF